MLEGRLNEFALPDVFQLLAFTRKTGLLRVTSVDAEGQVHFQDGAVSFAVADTRRPQLAARLAQHAPLSDAQQARVTDAARRGVASALCAELAADGTVDTTTLRDVVGEHIQDAVFSLMRLDDGSFAFDSAAGESSAFVTLPGDELVAEGGRRLVEWQHIHERMPATSAVLAMAPTPPGGQPVTLQPDQWRLLALLGSTRTVADLTEVSGQGEFATCQVLADLVEAGLVEAAASSETVDGAEVRGSVEAPVEPSVSQPAAVEPAVVGPAPIAPEPEIIAPEPVAPETETVAPEPAPEPVAPEQPWDVFDLDVAVADEAELEAEPVPEAEPEPQPQPRPQPELTPQPLILTPPPPPAPPAAPSPEPAHASAPEPAPGEPTRDRIVSLRQRMQDAGFSTAAPVISAGQSAPATPEPAPAAPEPAAETAAETPEPAAETPLAAVPYHATSSVDRASMARELASLGFDDDPTPAAPLRAAEPKTTGNGQHKRLTRDEDVSKGLLLRLIDGVKGA